MRHTRVKWIDGPSISVTRDADQVIFTPTRTQWSPDKLPVLHGGMRADHLSVPLKLRRDPPNEGTFCIHLTYSDGHHEVVAPLHPDQVTAFFKELGDALVERNIAQSFRVTPEELDELGFSVCLLKDELSARIADVVSAPKREYRIADSIFGGLSGGIEFHSPLLLNDAERTRTPLHPFILAVHSEAPSLALVFFDAWFDNEGPGWIAAPHPPPVQEILLDVISRHAGNALWKTMLVILRELQADCDLELLNQLAARPASGHSDPTP